MKKYLLYILIITLAGLSLAGSTLAASPTPTTNPSLLEKLSNEIASKTAQLNLVEKRGIIGTVTDSSDTQITLNDVNGNIRFVDVDELTNFSSSSSKSLGISDITKGMRIGVLGLYNKQSRRILARDVETIDQFPNIIFGQISLVDKTNFEITVIKSNGAKAVAEIEDITRTYSFSLGTMTKSGFSKTSQRETVFVVGFPDKQDESKTLASTVIILPSIQLSYLNITPITSPTIPPSTGSGIKLFPITK
jgi:hypothetical protein